MKTYFANINTMQELKAAYREWALKLHPDRGGDAEEFKAMANEHDDVFKRIQAGYDPEDRYTKYASVETPGMFRAIIEALMPMRGVEAELCGIWLWIRGNTREYKELLKEQGCKWHAKKKCWYWRPYWAPSSNRKDRDMSYIRAKYGSERVKGAADWEAREEIGA